MTEPPLKLRAQDAEDVQVIAAVLQDAIAPVCDMTYKADEKTFIMVVHRFRWDCVDAPEAEKTDCECFERVFCALEVEGVESVQRQGFDKAECDRMLELLTLTLEPDSLQFIFAGGAQVRLKLGKWQLRIKDFGEPWPTRHQPCHRT